MNMKRCDFRILCCLAFTLASCSSENTDSSNFPAGEAFTGSHLNVISMDTITVGTGTIKFDSIATSESSRILVGQYVDSVFGTIRSSSFMGMVPSDYRIDNEAVYNSIALYLKLDSYYYSDTLRANTIRVKRLMNTLKPYEGDYLYNTGEAEYYDKDLGILNYFPSPKGSDTLEIRLTDSVGKDIFDRFQQRDITSADQFRDYFKGIALLPGVDDDGAIIGFSKDTEASFIRLYYSVPGEIENVQEYLDIQLDLSSTPVPFFNQIIAEEPIPPLKSLVNEEMELKSEDAGGLAFIQSGVGIAAKIQFPHIKSIHDIKGRGTLLDAVLRIRPLTNSFDGRFVLRDTLSLYRVDRNNTLTSRLLVGEFPVQGTLDRTDEEFNDIYYEIPLGNYLEEMLNTERDTGEALILLPNDYNSTVDRFILNGKYTSSPYSTVLELTYAIYDEDE